MEENENVEVNEVVDNNVVSENEEKKEVKKA